MKIISDRIERRYEIDSKDLSKLLELDEGEIVTTIIMANSPSGVTAMIYTTRDSKQTTESVQK